MRRLLLPFIIAFASALEALLRHPLRAVLTGLGILVGVLSVTIVMTLGEGAEKAVAEQVAQMGENLLTIRARAERASGVANELPILTEADARAIEQALDQLEAVAPTLDGMVRVVVGQENMSAQVVGTTLSYFPARRYKIVSGAVWDESQQATAARVALVGPTVVKQLFDGLDPVGESVRIGKHLFRVIGVLSEKGQTPFGMDLDNVVVMPISTMRGKVTPSRPGEVGQIAIAADADADLESVKRSIRSLLRQRHQISDDDDDDFSIRDQARIAEAQQGVIGVMRLLLLCIALVSLIIGGIGVMNIMLVSVAERSKEIGTRMAVGARASDILIQFLIEAMVLSLLGGAAGVLLSGLALAPLHDFFGWDLAISLRTLVVSLVVSLTTGVLFGLLPARRAAKLDPVVALRSE